jgi:hypothetical protein
MGFRHSRVDAWETAAVTDEAPQFSNRTFLTEYLTAAPP